jgi:3',5'-cyclic AMP phosphodiesterase CpdA
VRIVQLSDTHVSSRGGITQTNLERLIRHINHDLKPDLVVHTGDVIALRPGTTSDWLNAKRLLDLLEASYLVVPGNHDLGQPGPEPWEGLGCKDGYADAFRAVFGDIPWLRILDDDWAAVGVADTIMGSGIEDERLQWAWLEEVIPSITSRYVMLFSHKPVWSPLPDGQWVGQIGFAPEHAERLLQLFRPGQLRVVSNGHLHRYRYQQRGDIVEIWCPATSNAVKGDKPDMPFPAALKQVGVVELRLLDGSVDAYFRSVADVVEMELLTIPEIRDELEEIKRGVAAS